MLETRKNKGMHEVGDGGFPAGGARAHRFAVSKES